MSGDIEFGNCDMCNEEAALSRKYYRYDIECDYCNRKENPHFEIIKYCNKCEPNPPRRVSVSIEPLQE